MSDEIIKEEAVEEKVAVEQAAVEEKPDSLTEDRLCKSTVTSEDYSCEFANKYNIIMPDTMPSDFISDGKEVEIHGSTEQRSAIFAALAAYTAEVQNPKNSADNPYFKSKYAPLSEVLDAVRPILGKHGLAIIQPAKVLDNGSVAVQSILTHKDGGYMAFPSLVGKPAKADIQGIGAVITYLRRFSINTISGVAGEVDDDGNAAAGLAKKQAQKKAAPKAGSKDELVAACAAYTKNDAQRRKTVVDALKAVEPNGDIRNINSAEDIKKALDVVKGLG